VDLDVIVMQREQLDRCQRVNKENYFFFHIFIYFLEEKK